MARTTHRDALFDETQRLHENLIVRVAVPASCLTATGIALVVTLAQGSASPWMIGLILALGLGVPLLLAMLPMRTIVGPDALRVRSVVWYAHEIPNSSITSARALRYNPLLDCGGWGLRLSPKYGMVYNVSGDRGVHVTYNTPEGKEKSMLIGSRRDEELATAIRVAAGLDDAILEHDRAS